MCPCAHRHWTGGVGCVMLLQQQEIPDIAPFPPLPWVLLQKEWGQEHNGLYWNSVLVAPQPLLYATPWAACVRPWMAVLAEKRAEKAWEEEGTRRVLMGSGGGKWWRPGEKKHCGDMWCQRTLVGKCHHCPEEDGSRITLGSIGVVNPKWASVITLVDSLMT